MSSHLSMGGPQSARDRGSSRDRRLPNPASATTKAEKHYDYSDPRPSSLPPPSSPARMARRGAHPSSDGRHCRLVLIRKWNAVGGSSPRRRKPVKPARATKAEKSLIARLTNAPLIGIDNITMTGLAQLVCNACSCSRISQPLVGRLATLPVAAAAAGQSMRRHEHGREQGSRG